LGNNRFFQVQKEEVTKKWKAFHSAEVVVFEKWKVEKASCCKATHTTKSVTTKKKDWLKTLEASGGHGTADDSDSAKEDDGEE
jgi:hypothetical protein